MPSIHQDDARRSSTRQRSNGNGRRKRSTTPAPSGSRARINSNNTNNSASIKSQHHILPEEFVCGNCSDGPCNESPGSKSSLRSPPGAPPPPPPPPPPYSRGSNVSFHVTSSAAGRAGNNARGGSLSLPEEFVCGNCSDSPCNESPGSKTNSRSPPGAPPPPPPYSRGGNTSLHLTSSAAGNDASRGRSLSTARSSSKKKSSKHGESKDSDHGVIVDDRRGRSLSAARSRSKKAASKESRMLPLIDTNGEQRPRSRSTSKSRGRVVKQEGRSTSKPRQTDALILKSSSQLSNHQTVPEDVFPNRNPFQQFKLIEDEIKKNQHLSLPNSAAAAAEDCQTSDADRRAPDTDASQKSFKHVIAGVTSRRRSRSRGRSDSRSRNKVVAAPSPTKNQEQSSSALSRKFVVEVGNNNEVVQVFEFSDNGTLPQDGLARTKKEPAFIETIRRKYSGDEEKESSSGGGRGRSTSRSRRSRGKGNDDNDDKAVVATRKIVIESDYQDNIIGVTEFGALQRTTATAATTTTTTTETSRSRRSRSSGRDDGKAAAKKIVIESDYRDNIIKVTESTDDGNDLPETHTTKRDESPFSKRQTCLAQNGIPKSAASPDDFMNSSNERRSSRQPSPARSLSILRSSIRTPFKGNRSSLSQTSVSFGDNKSKKSDVGLDLSDKTLDRSDKTLDRSDKSLDRSGKSLDRSDNILDISDGSFGSSRGASKRSVRFVMDKQSNRQKDVKTALSSSANSQGLAPAYPRPREVSALDISEKSDESSVRPSVSFMKDQDRNEMLASLVPSKRPIRAKPTLDSSERSDESSARRSVSFMMDQDNSYFRGSSTILTSSMASSSYSRPSAYEFKHTPPNHGRSNPTRLVTPEDLPGFRRARSVSSSRNPNVIVNDPTLIIDDSSSLTAGSQPTATVSARGRSAALSSMASGQDRSEVPRQSRSLSRTRNVVMQEVDFDPAASITKPPSTVNYSSAFRRDALPYEKVPVQKSMISHSTADTYVSALTFEEEDSFETTQAVKYGDPFMNSTLTIFENEGDADDESLLSDPNSTSFSTGPKVHIMEDDSVDVKREKESKHERRSRIRRMLSVKASSKRKPTPSSSNPSLEKSEERRETVDTDRSGQSSMMMKSAQNSLLRHQSPAAKRGSNQESERSGNRKSRLSRFLSR